MAERDAAGEVRAAADALVEAFAAHDPAAYFASFAPEASFVFYTAAERLPDRSAYERLWAKWEREDGFRVHGCTTTDADIRVFGDVAVLAHDVETDVELGGTRETVHERETIVFERREGRWLAVHEHLSPRPEEEGNG